MEVKELIDILEDRNVFITGGGGVGKSYLIKQLSEELPLVITASTGIAAVNIGGQTLHSWAGIGIGDKPIEQIVGFLNSPKGKNKLREINNADFLVIDEISMLNSYILDYVNEVLKQVRGINEPFGGIRVIMVGDMLQLPPVKIGETVEINGANRLIDFCFKSYAWRELNPYVINLTKVYRQQDKDFIETLNKIRQGECDLKSEKLLQKRNFSESTEIDENIVKLYSVNAKADAENDRRFKALKGKAYKFYATDLIRSYIDGKSQMVGPTNSKLPSWDKAKYEAFDRDCRVPKVLELKKGARVILLSNTDFNSGLVNSTCGNVYEINDHSVKVKFDNGEECWIQEDNLELKDVKNVKISRTQLPLMLAYALTIHKAQGLTLDKVFIDFDRVFADGQAYVALSRAKTLEGLYLKHFNASKIFANDEVKNFYSIIK